VSAVELAPVTLPWAIRSGAATVWRVLPSALLAGAAATVTLLPFAAAALGAAPGWLLALTTLPPALAATSLAGFAAPVVRHERPRLADLGRVDSVLALVLAAVASGAGALLTTPGTLQLAGAVLAALGLFLALPVLAYGAVRGRRGFSAVRGGLILAMLRPGAALTLAGLAVLAGFAVAASAGVLALAAGPLLLGVAAAYASALLAQIDHSQGAAA
jgi:hypothetical protein